MWGCTISKFHNSVGGEKLALGWHLFGVTLGSVMLAIDLYVAAWAYVTPHPELIDFIFQLIRDGALVCAFYHFLMACWHINASVDHVGHMKELEAAKSLVRTET